MMALLLSGLFVVAGTESLIARMSLMASRKLALMQQVQTATSVVKYWEKLAQSGGLSDLQAKRNALEALRAMRYGAEGSGYFGVYDSNAIRILNPTDPKLETKSAEDSVDSDGKHVALEVIRSDAPSGTHFTEYRWPHPGQSQPVDKLVYSAYDPAWDWHLYTGAYVDDIDATFRGDLFSGLVSVLVVGAVLSTAMLLLIRSIRRSLGGDPAQAATIAREIARGNLAVLVSVAHLDDQSLMASLADMRNRLVSIVGGIRLSADAIALAAAEVAQGSGYLSQRTEEQAASLQETAASMQQLTTAVRQNSEAAVAAACLASNTSQIAREGSGAVGRAVNTMDEISRSSLKVAAIIGVIEGIAFQTNILALNAAVEAARAGDQGRGFAVVAGEVRTLAQRSALAAKEIKELITESVERAGTGANTVGEAGETIVKVVDAVDQMNVIIDGISVASSDQTNGIEQINQAVKQMDDTTQQNAALVEQAASAAQSMSEQAKELKMAVSIFSV
jgi:methyl-accepting chemotaxis protein